LCLEKRPAQQFKRPRGMFLTPCARNILTRSLLIYDSLLMPHRYTTPQSDLRTACLTRLYAHYRTSFVPRGFCLFKARSLGLQSVSTTAWAGVPGGAPCISFVNTPAGCRCQRGSRPHARGSARKALPDGSAESLKTAWIGCQWSERCECVQQWSSFTSASPTPGEAHPDHIVVRSQSPRRARAGGNEPGLEPLRSGRDGLPRLGVLRDPPPADLAL
jgi:hypothetical protein